MLALNLPTYITKITEIGGKKMIFDPIRRKYIVLTPEEWVRQHFVNYLITEKKYPIELIANEVGIELNGTIKRCDTIVYDKFAKPLVVIEYKSPTIHIAKAAFDQIIRYNMSLKVRYLIVSNGINHYCCHLNYEKESYSFLDKILDYNEL